MNRLMTGPLAFGVFERSPYARRCLYAHHCRASLVEVKGVLVKVGMLRHEGVLVIHRNPLRFDEGSSDGIPRFNAGIGGAVGCFGFDRGDRSPDKLAATRERPNGLQKEWKAGFELRLGVAPTVQAVVEVNHGERDILECRELGNLTGKAGTAHGR